MGKGFEELSCISVFNAGIQLLQDAASRVQRLHSPNSHEGHVCRVWGRPARDQSPEPDCRSCHGSQHPRVDGQHAGKKDSQASREPCWSPRFV